MTDQPLVLGIETSCDETGVGMVRGETLLADAMASSVDEHARFGGVVPEVASRAHLEAMVPTIERACRDGRRAPRATSTRSPSPPGPGSPARCWSGSPRPRRWRSPSASRCTASTTSPRHVAVDILEHGPLPEPTVALLVSGGHSSLLLVPDVTARRAQPLGATIDDAAGEAFDKVARLLGLPFPGGPYIDRAAREGDRLRRLPARADRRARHGAAPLRLLVLRAEDGGRPLGRARRRRPGSRSRSPTSRPASRRRSSTC